MAEDSSVNSKVMLRYETSKATQACLKRSSSKQKCIMKAYIFKENNLQRLINSS